MPGAVGVIQEKDDLEESWRTLEANSAASAALRKRRERQMFGLVSSYT